MPALSPIVGVARCVAVGSVGGVACVNVFHVGINPRAAYTQAQIDALATMLRAAFVTRFIPIIHTTYTLYDVTCTDLSSDLGVTGVKTGSTAGTKAGVGMASNVAQCITWKIARHYRGGHPRTYLAPPDNSTVSNSNRWQSTHVTAAGNAADGFRTDMTAALPGPVSPELVCVHRYKGWTLDVDKGKRIPTPLLVPLVDTITGNTFDGRIDSQRRRLGPDI